MTPARILHALDGAPAVDGADAFDGTPCFLCAMPVERGMLVHRWQGASFTDQNKCRAQGAEYICEACVWACSWVAPPGYYGPHNPREIDAKGKPKKGVNLRLFSHLYDAGEYAFANKADKPRIREWLRAPKRGPWFAAIADTGQKHTLPWAPMNGGPRGTILFEEAEIDLPDDDDGWRALDDTIALLTAGATKDEVLRGEYRPQTWQRCASELRAYEEAHAHLRGGAWHRLLVWLAQRDEEQVAERQEAEKEAKRAKNDKAKRARKGKAPSGDGARDPSAAGAVPRGRRKRAQALDADRGQDPCRGASVREPAGVGEQAQERPADRKHEQIPLF